MNDIFYEQILPVKASFTKQLLRLFIIGVTVLLFLFLLLTGGLLGVTFCFLLVYLVFFFLLPRFKKEYEYSLTNSNLQISAIYNKESRKDLISFDLHSAEIIAPANSPRLKYYDKATRQAYVSSDSELQAYSIILKNDQKLLNIIIQPNDTMKEHLKRRVPSKMYND